MAGLPCGAGCQAILGRHHHQYLRGRSAGARSAELLRPDVGTATGVKLNVAELSNPDQYSAVAEHIAGSGASTFSTSRRPDTLSRRRRHPATDDYFANT